MKERIGFVSNSSSTSFILKNEAQVKEYSELKSYKVTDIIAKLQSLSDVWDAMAKGLYSEWNGVPGFLMQEMNIYESNSPYTETLIALKELELVAPGCYITEPYDRDHASERGWSLPEFMGGFIKHT